MNMLLATMTGLRMKIRNDLNHKQLSKFSRKLEEEASNASTCQMLTHLGNPQYAYDKQNNNGQNQAML